MLNTKFFYCRQSLPQCSIKMIGFIYNQKRLRTAPERTGELEGSGSIFMGVMYGELIVVSAASLASSCVP